MGMTLSDWLRHLAMAQIEECPAWAPRKQRLGQELWSYVTAQAYEQGVTVADWLRQLVADRMMVDKASVVTPPPAVQGAPMDRADEDPPKSP